MIEYEVRARDHQQRRLPLRESRMELCPVARGRMDDVNTRLECVPLGATLDHGPKTRVMGITGLL